MGRRTLAMYVLSIVLTAVGFAYAVDLLMPREWFTSALVHLHTCHHEHLDLFSLGCTIVLSLLLLNAFWLRHKHHGCGCHHEASTCGCGHHDSTCSCNDSACNCNDSACNCHKPDAPQVNTYKVEGLHCNHCRMNAEKVVNQLPGVISAKVELSKKTITVEGSATKEEIGKALSEIGFEITD
jgi:copper chaperone CopZ